MEGRWIHDERILNHYIRFWFSDATSASSSNKSSSSTASVENPNLSSYTNWIGHASWHRYLLNGNATFVASLLDCLARTFRDTYVPKCRKEIIWNGTHQSTNSSGRNYHVLSCWWQNDGQDAMEVSISGSGCRPTIASAMYGEADTIVKLTELVGAGNSKDLKEEFTKWREISRSLNLDYHWDLDIQSFVVIPTVFDGDHDDGSDGSGDSNCDLSSIRTPNRTAHVRELLGFIPWYFESLIPQNRTSRYLPGFANGRIAASLLQLFLRPRRLLERSIVAVRDSHSF